MNLGIEHHGIVERDEDGVCRLVMLGRNGQPPAEIVIPESLSREYHLWTGEIVEGEVVEETIVSISSINGLDISDSANRPSPKDRRASWERVAPNKHISLALSADDMTGRILDLAAPLGQGCAGIIYGPHGTGLTHTLRSVVNGASLSYKTSINLLIRAREEEATDWRRRFPGTDVVVCPSAQTGASAEDTVRVANLVMACAQRQNELGRHVLLTIDSLTGLWAAMLDTEEADAQREADHAFARRDIQAWIQAAGDFSGEGPLGMRGPGGSLTIVGTVWHQEIDIEAEEEGETHPHLRLLEHLLNETDWRVPLLGELARRRLFPAIDIVQGYSRHDQQLLPNIEFNARSRVLSALGKLDPIPRYNELIDAIEQTPDLVSLSEHFGEEDETSAQDRARDLWNSLFEQ
jgi:transcription termination factor Rho